MHEFIAKKVIESLSYQDSEEKFKGNIIRKEDIKQVHAKGSKILFIDGGNASIFASSDFDLSFIRVFACVMDGKKVTERLRKEFYLLTYAKGNFFECELYSFREIDDNYGLNYNFESGKDKNMLNNIKNNVKDNNNKKLDEENESKKADINKNDKIKKIKTYTIDFNESSLRTGNNNIPISKIPEVIRAELELQSAVELCEKNNNISIVLDGNLEADQILKKENLERLKKACKDKNNRLAALSKTCSLLTDSGKSIISALKKHMDGASSYNIGKIDGNDVFIVKLHKRADYLFRLDGDYLADELANISNDASFPGYPYGLIIADKYARVTNKEIEYMKTKLFLQLKDKDIIMQQNSLNAHNILDNMS